MKFIPGDPSELIKRDAEIMAKAGLSLGQADWHYLAKLATIRVSEPADILAVTREVARDS